MLTVVASLAVLLATSPAPPPVTIYIGPFVRDGFAETDDGVRDSIKDLRTAVQMEIGKKRARLVDDESTADLKLYVMARGLGMGTTTTSTSSPNKVKRLETLLRVGTYERPFVVAVDDSWWGIARRISKDVSAWLEANHERVVSKR